MTDTPEPLVPREVDLRDFPYMKLDVMRLRDSRLAGIEQAEAFRASVLSWCVAWHQLPAASLPDDDVSLAQMLGWGRDVRGWRKVRAAGGLHGWILCSDGRLYHPVVAEKAIEAWAAKQSQRARTAAARQAREVARKNKTAAQSQGVSQALSHDEIVSVTDDVTASKGEREGEGEGNREESPPLSPSVDGASKRSPVQSKSMEIEADFAAFWAQYPRRDDRGRAIKVYAAARKKGVAAADILAGAMRYAAERQGQDPKFTKMAATWLNAEAWANGATKPDAPMSAEQGWRNKVRQFVASGLWLGDWGEPPGKTGCRVPAAILIEFGFSRDRN